MAKLAQIGDAAPCYGHIEWSTDLLELRLDPKRRRHRPLSNASKNAPFWCRMRELWPKQWRRVCWIRGWRGSWVGDELQLGEDHDVGVSSVAMSSSQAKVCMSDNLTTLLPCGWMVEVTFIYEIAIYVARVTFLQRRTYAKVSVS
jgi:hypothetical protein